MAGLPRDAGAEAILAHLRANASPENCAGMARYGIDTRGALGIPNSVLRPLARRLGRDHDRADLLWQSGIREARLLACFTDEPGRITTTQARRWAEDFNSWEIVDHAADLFVRAGLHTTLIAAFAQDEREYVRRAAFAMIAACAVHLKAAPDTTFLQWLDLIETHAGDGRNFVKKAVNWALRQIGKRSASLHAPALALAERLAASDEGTRRWIGRDAVRELTAEKTLARLARKA
ncbi:DNA alkylation repair protein [Mesorhizobium xinjiangense]|uniref:DNA alkylation repair protein n=1 Tax=Mesorhizobium xinjiangense TaxID=2678685 RepID=UPI0012EDB435|nr:DNA alkylation repair protein [Mesorhizobium xinjiangense]